MRRILSLLPLITALAGYVVQPCQAESLVDNNLFVLAEKGTAADVRPFLKAQPEIGSTSITKALHISAINNSKEVLKLFIDAGGDVEDREGTMLLPEDGRASDSDSFSTTPFYDAVSNGKYENAKLLVSYGADVNSTGFEGDTALHAAVLKDNLDFVKFLISHGADPKMKNVANNTPCEIANDPNFTIHNRKSMLKVMNYCK